MHKESGIKEMISVHFGLVPIPPISRRDGVQFVARLLRRTRRDLHPLPALDIAGNALPHSLSFRCTDRQRAVIRRQLSCCD